MLEKQNIITDFNYFFDILCSLETIVKITQTDCQNKEFYSEAGNFSYENRLILSEERNHYINMLTLAIDKIKLLKELNLSIENKLFKN